MRLVAIPGFSLRPSSWAGIAAHLPHVDALLLEVPRRGSFSEVAAELVAEGGSGVYAGYSMGGRLALAGALRRPEAVRALVLVSASPGIEDPRAREARREDDFALAAWIEANDLDAFLERWLANPLFEGVERRRARRHRIEDPEEIAGQLRRLGQGVQPPLWDRLGELDMPVVVLAGERDPAYAEIATRTAAAIGPNASRVLVPGAGHALLLEAPQVVTGTIARVLGE